MNLQFWLLDIDAELMDGRPVVRLWGIDDRGRRVLLIDRSALPHFYVLPRADTDADRLCNAIVGRRSRLPLIASAEVVARKLVGRPVGVVCVCARAVDPTAIGRLARQIGKLPGALEVLEDDIRLSAQYLRDRDVQPCGWQQADVLAARIPEGVQVDAAFDVLSMQALERHELPALKLMAFTIVACGELGAPRPERDPVVVLATTSSDGSRSLWAAEDGDDAGLLEGLTSEIRRFDPDILLGYGTNRGQFSYLFGRARQHGQPLRIGRSGLEPHQSLFGHVSVTGRAHVDLADWADDILELKSKGLDEACRMLGMSCVLERIDDLDLAGYWSNRELRPQLIDQVRRDADSILRAGEVLLADLLQLAGLIGMPLDQVLRAAAGFRVESFLLKAARRFGELAPKRVDRPYATYVGGLVSAPKPGLHERVAVLDVHSMYPSLMVRYNISPDTYVVEPPAPQQEVHVAPEVGHRFRNEPAGFYKKVLVDLIEARDQIRARMQRTDPASPSYRLLDARQKVLKIVANATYGYAGWLGARWYMKPVAEAVAAWGRDAITRVQSAAQDLGLEVLYSDTDSVFVHDEPHRIAQLQRRVQSDLGLEIRSEKVFERLLFTEAKKRYAGLLPDGRTDIVGLEVVRGDWAQVAKDLQEQVLKIVLRELPLDHAREHVRQFVEAIRGRRVPFRDLILWKTLTKPVEQYEANAAHVAAARRLADAGYAPRIGDRVGYVIVKGKGPLYQRAVPYQLVGYDAVDTEYYVASQILPAAMRVLEGFGIGHEELTQTPRPVSRESAGVRAQT